MDNLERLKTDLGERGVYDAASQCSRCGYCLQACPTYVVSGREEFSPRGRNQLVRLMLEGKLSEPKAAEEALATCLLCGACSTACYAHVPTAELVLEGRRRVRAGKVHWLNRFLARLLARRPGLLARLLKLANLARRLGLSRLARRTGLLRLFGLRGLELADEHLQEAPLSFLFERLRQDPELADFTRARWLYFAPCGPNFLYPEVGLATVKALKAALGRGAFLDNPCCGLLSYNYGELEQAKVLARQVIGRFEAAAFSRDRRSGTAEEVKAAAVVGDCSSCVAHLKNYPQLFLEDPVWRPRAERFAAAVKDAVEAVAADMLRGIRGGAAAGKVTYHDSCRARNGQGIADAPRRLMKALYGDAYVELPEADWCCGGAGMYAFTEPELSDEVLRRKIGNIAAVQAGLVATSSTSCLIQLAHGMKKYYPEGRVVHLMELLAWEDGKT